MIGIETENGFQQYDGTSVPDTELSSTSTNSVQNKVTTEAINQLNNDLSAYNVTQEFRFEGGFTIYSGGYREFTINVSKTGYTPIGIVGVHNAHLIQIVIACFEIINSNAYLAVQSKLDTVVNNGDFGVTVLYKRNI